MIHNKFIDMDKKTVFYTNLSPCRDKRPETRFPRTLKDRHNVDDVGVLVDEMCYFTVLVQTDLSGGLSYSDRSIIDELLIGTPNCKSTSTIFPSNTGGSRRYPSHQETQTR